jgi:hypothetical protein
MQLRELTNDITDCMSQSSLYYGVDNCFFMECISIDPLTPNSSATMQVLNTRMVYSHDTTRVRYSPECTSICMHADGMKGPVSHTF